MNSISVRKDPFPENPNVEWYRLMIDDNPLYSYFEGFLNGDISNSVALPMTVNMNDLHDLALRGLIYMNIREIRILPGF